MPSLAQITSLLAFAGAAIAKPVALDQRSPYSIDQAHHTERSVNTALKIIQYRREVSHHIPAELVKSAKRSTAEIQDALRKRHLSGSVVATPSDEIDTEYLSPLIIGGKKLHVMLSSATSAFWVFSSLQPQDQLEGHSYYTVNPANEKKGYYFDVSYDGNATYLKGTVYTETIKLGDITTVQELGAANYTDDSLADDITDGLVGIGFGYTNGIRPRRGLTFFETIMPRLGKRQYSVALRHKAPGSYDFGDIDWKKVASPFVYTQATDENGWGAWRFFAQGFAIGHDAVTPRRMNMHLTTSSSISYTDPDIVAHYWGLVPGSKYDKSQDIYSFPCNAKNLPDLTYIISGSRQVIPGKYMNGGLMEEKSTMCYGNLQNIGGGVDFSLIGTNFFKDKYVLHDMNDEKNMRLGFAKLAPGKK